MRGGLQHDERTYRRGLIMGLTLAEVMLLVLFALLLILGWVDQRREASRVIEGVLNRLVPDLMAHEVGSNEFEDGFRRLVLAASLAAAVEKAAAGLEEFKRQPGESDEAMASRVGERLGELVALGRRVEEELGSNRMSVPILASANEFVTEAGREYEESVAERGYGSSRIWLQDLRIAAAACQEETGGRGMEFPPCSETNGRADYIFDVRLREASIVVHDNNLPEVEERKKEWPLSPIRFGEEVSGADFVSMTDRLFQYSVANQCRFFVRVIDETPASAKLAYKRQLETVERHFYKYLQPEATTGAR